jgi:hypothetical protein
MVQVLLIALFLSPQGINSSSTLKISERTGYRPIDSADDGSFMRSLFSKQVNLFDACWAIGSL